MPQQSGSLIGRRIGTYTVLSFLGAGGMGEVYRARDEKLQRDVAIKVLPATVTSDPERLARFEREARMLAALNHPSIASIYGYQEADDVRGIVLELVEGPTLAERLSTGPIPVNEALAIGRQITEALEAAHGKGIVHRDLKPANVKLAQDGRVKVLDFGLAKACDEQSATEYLSQAPTMPAGPTQAGVVLGTMAYMSPEQARGRPVDKRTDIWAFGCVLYEMLTGRLPFGGGSASDIIAGILEREPKWEDLPQRTPPRVRQLLGVCLQKDQRQRLRDIGDAHLELEAALAPDAPIKGPITAARRFSRMAVASGILASLVAAAGLWIGLERYRAGRLTSVERRLPDGNRRSPNPEANAYYERALIFGGTGTPDPEKAHRMIERALETDSKFAAARAELAFNYVVRIVNGRSNDASLFYKAETEVRQALHDDPRCGRAHSVLALVYLLQGRKELVRAELDQALEENPSDVTAHSWLLDYHRLNGDYQRAREQADWLIRESPLFWPGHLQLGELLREQGDPVSSIREHEKALEQAAGNVDALAGLARAYLDSGNLQLARQTLERASDNDRANYGLRQQRALLLALEGRTGEASQEMDADLKRYADIQIFGPALVADFYAVMGDANSALEWLDRAVRMGDDREMYFRRNPHLTTLRAHPRFKQILDAVVYRRQQRAAR